MTQSPNAGFEYTDKAGESPFETFLKYTDEKEKSSAALGVVLQENCSAGCRLLDIGAGTGEYLRLALGKAGNIPDLELTLLEPSADLIVHLEEQFREWPGDYKIVHSDFENFSENRPFDLILVSHVLYHIPRATWTHLLEKMLSLLAPHGKLVIVARGEDAQYDFKMKFKPHLFPGWKKAITADDILAHLPDSVATHITKRAVTSELRIPIVLSQADTETIIEFSLNKKWAEIPKDIQDEIWDYLEAAKGKFAQEDQIVLVEKT